MEMEELDLPAKEAAALLESSTPLADIYEDFRNREGHMDHVRECIEDLAKGLLEAKLEATRAIPLYQQSGEYAREHGELEAFRASHKANIACRDAIEAEIREPLAPALRWLPLHLWYETDHQSCSTVSSRRCFS